MKTITFMLFAILLFVKFSDAENLILDCTYSVHELNVKKRSMGKRQTVSADTSYTWICDTTIDGSSAPLIRSYGEIIPFSKDSISGRRGYPDSSTMRSAYGIDSLTGRLWVILEQGDTVSIPPVLRNDTLFYNCFEIELIATSTGHSFHLDLFAFWDDTVNFDFKFDSLVTKFRNSVDTVALLQLKGVYKKQVTATVATVFPYQSHREKNSLFTSHKRFGAMFDLLGRRVTTNNCHRRGSASMKIQQIPNTGISKIPVY